MWRAREILEAEGTAKSSSVIKENKCRRTKSDMNLYAESAGTVPYLGTFLTGQFIIIRIVLDWLNFYQI